MAFDKATLPTHCSPKAVTLPGKVITSASAYRHGSVAVVEISLHDGTAEFIKFNGSIIEIGGTAEMGTGASVTW